MFRFFFVVSVAVCGCFVLVAADPSNDDNHLENLLVQLDKGYKRFVAPKNVTISIAINYLCAILDERSLTLESKVFETYKWTDTRLSWNPSQHGGIDLVFIPAKLVWLPDDFRVLNSVGNFADRDDINVAIDHNGEVTWLPLSTYKSLCTKSPSYREDHTYNCRIGFGPWTFGAPRLPIKLLYPSGVVLDGSVFHDECPHVVGQHRTEFKTEKYDCCADPFYLLNFRFDVHRRGFDKASNEERPAVKAERRQAKNCFWPHCK